MHWPPWLHHLYSAWESTKWVKRRRRKIKQKYGKWRHTLASSSWAELWGLSHQRVEQLLAAPVKQKVVWLGDEVRGGARVINTICCVAWNKTPRRKIRRRKGGRRVLQSAPAGSPCGPWMTPHTSSQLPNCLLTYSQSGYLFKGSKIYKLSIFNFCSIYSLDLDDRTEQQFMIINVFNLSNVSRLTCGSQ